MSSTSAPWRAASARSSSAGGLERLVRREAVVEVQRAAVRNDVPGAAPLDARRGEHLAEDEAAARRASRGARAASSARSAPARCTAFSPCHGRAECAARPVNVTVAWIEPTQPSWSTLSVGSRQSARSTPSRRPWRGGRSSRARSRGTGPPRARRARGRGRRSAPRAGAARRAPSAPRGRPSCRRRRARRAGRPRAAAGGGRRRARGRCRGGRRARRAGCEWLPRPPHPEGRPIAVSTRRSPPWPPTRPFR